MGLNELGVIDNETVADCAKLCDANALCVSFEYHKPGQGSRCQLSATCSAFNMTAKGGEASSKFVWYLKEPRGT